MMKVNGFTLALAGIFAGHALGQAPTVTGLLNNYSFTLPGLPNYGIAQGSIFEIWGTHLSSQTTGLLNPPLQSTLNGVTVSVTVNGTTTNPLFYFQSPTQMDAVLPSATPVGTGTITVTNSAGVSTPFPIQVVESAFGLLTANSGTGPAQGFDANNGGTLFGFSSAVNPGEILELWGTGLGPVPNDATYVAVSEPVAVYIGGVSATLKYAGRSGYAGLDQINVQVPAGVTGCYVSLVVQTGNYVSNFGTLPVAASGRICTDPDNPITASVLDQLGQTGSLNMGVLSISQLINPGIKIDGVVYDAATIDKGLATFSKITSAQINGGAFPAASDGYSSMGSCFVEFFTTTGDVSTNDLTSGDLTLPVPFQFTYLNAGTEINLNGPDGAVAMLPQTLNGVDNYITPSASTFIPASGALTFSNGSGGTDVGAFTTPQIQIPAPVTWSNISALSTVTRSNGLTVNWTGGEAGASVEITGISYACLTGSCSGTSDYVAGYFTCRAPAAARTFTVPPAVLLSLPPSSTVTKGGVAISTAVLLLSSFGPTTSFTAPNLDVGLMAIDLTNLVYVTVK
jgi:uncharacterized protein (TIGR03437 family)